MTFEYSIDKNSEIAKNLKGHLMLVTGDIDNNVHPSNTYRLADAFIKANKRFDFMILPGQRHGTYGGRLRCLEARRLFRAVPAGRFRPGHRHVGAESRKAGGGQDPCRGAVTGGRGGTQVQQQTGGRGRGGR